MRRFLLMMAVAALACGVRAQAPAAKIAVTSLVGDQVAVTLYRDATGTNLSNSSSVLKMPGPMLDLAVLKTAQDAIEKARPGAAVYTLKVPAVGSSVDPALVYADDQPVAGNVLVEALKQQGFTHLLTATRHRNANIIRLADGAVGTGRGTIEGLGFYVDPTIAIQNMDTGERSEGMIAPYLYIRLRLLDLSTMAVRAQAITANSVAGSARNRTGADAWGALTAEEKMKALDALIMQHVATAVPLLFESEEPAQPRR